MRRLFHIQGIALLLVVTTYCGVVVTMVLQWNNDTTLALGTFAIFAQSYARKFFEWVAGGGKDGNEDAP